MRVALVAATAGDARDVMVLGESGLLAVCPPHNRPVYKPSESCVIWPNGARAKMFSAEEPNRLRGPQHEIAWCDEIAAWKYPQDAWDNLVLGLRFGASQCVVTTTPRPTPLVKQLVKESAVTGGTTYENKANLSAKFLNTVLKKYEGTRIGLQELYAKLLEDTPGALWSIRLIEENRVRYIPDLLRVVVGVDPAVTSNEGSSETGIVVAGISDLGHAYVLADLSGHYTPLEWATKVVDAFDHYEADCVVAEVNNGGDLVETNVHTVRRIPIKKVRASRGKRARAEPIAGLDEKHEIHHVGVLAQLEDQMTTWDASSGAPSPDRMDARVWALTELMLGDREAAEYQGFAPVLRRE